MADHMVKKFDLDETEVAKLRKFSDLNETTVSGLLRTWLEGYVEYGSDVEARIKSQVQTFVPRELNMQATTRAAREGINLVDVIRAEIAGLDDL